MCRLFACSLLAAVLAGAAAPPAVAADPCSDFKWNVSKEHALFSGSPVSLRAGKDIPSAPTIDADRLYLLELTPQDQVAFAVSPGKKMLTDGAYAGLAVIKINAPGAYRVSVDVPFWIDVVAGGKLVPTKDFQGQRGCDAPHKIVEYELAGAQPFVLQVSGMTMPTVRVTVTRSPHTQP
jgi:hypothetical protein